MSTRKSMTVQFYAHSITRRAESIALCNTGATENFLSLEYAKWLQLLIKQLATPRNVWNINGTMNSTGQIKYYTDMDIQTRSRWVKMRFFLTNLGGNHAILRYPWFTAIQPKIDWKMGWIDHTHLPIILRALNFKQAKILPRTVWTVRKTPEHQYFIGKVTIASMEPKKEPEVPYEYRWHKKIFSKEESQQLPKHTVWDHAIELLPGAPATLPGRLLPLTQEELEEARKFVKEHLLQNTIQPSWSPYAANFFFVKKKDGKLWPVQDYRPLNKWTKRNWNVSPLIPAVIDWLAGCTLFTKFDIQWGYNNIRIKPGDKWKAAFPTLEGLFEPTVMFFGLTNSPVTFQMMMNTIFQREVQEGWFSIFMDDGIIYTKKCMNETVEQHIKWHRTLVHHIFNILEANNLYIKPEKCTFEQEEIEYLGVIIGKGHLKMDPKKLKGVANYAQPKNPTEVHAFLGFTGYYQYFVQGYSQIVRPLLYWTSQRSWKPGIGEMPKKRHSKHWRTRCAVHPYYSNQISTRNSTCRLTSPLMAWVPYSHRREELDQPTQQNPDYTQWCTIQRPSPL
jgi:Reverse transcriptase (RNA-dependent DNA polymerase)